MKLQRPWKQQIRWLRVFCWCLSCSLSGSVTERFFTFLLLFSSRIRNCFGLLVCFLINTETFSLSRIKIISTIFWVLCNTCQFCEQFCLFPSCICMFLSDSSLPSFCMYQYNYSLSDLKSTLMQRLIGFAW